MIIETIKNLSLHNKLLKDPSLYSRIMQIDKNITMQDAFDAISVVNPKKTEVIETSDKDVFKKMLTINSYEFVFPGVAGITEIPQGYTDIIPIKNTDEKVYVIKGSNIKVGERLIKLDGSVVKSHPLFDENEINIIVKLDFRVKKRYLIVVYIPNK